MCLTESDRVGGKYGDVTSSERLREIETVGDLYGDFVERRTH